MVPIFLASLLFAIASARLNEPTLTEGSGVIVDCSSGKGGPYSMMFTSLSLTPDPPVRGQSASLIANSTTGNPTAVSGGKGSIQALMDGLPVYSSPPISACGLTTVSLPLDIGDMLITALPCTTTPVPPSTATSVSMALNLGTDVPKNIKLTVLFTMKDQSSAPLFCLNATFNM